MVDTSEDTVKIGNFVAKRSHLEDINKYISNNQDDQAIEQLCRRFRLEEDEARSIVLDWYSYYN